jgi:probable HAF family extracellular repeat protein
LRKQDSNHLVAKEKTMTPTTSLVRPYAITDLGALDKVASESRAFGINAAGQVVGWSHTDRGGEMHAFLHSNGNMTDLGTFGGRDSFAYGINNAGDVSGSRMPLTGKNTPSSIATGR